MDNGWIKLHRKFLNWEWHQKPEIVLLFINLLLLANHEDNKWQGITIKRGQLITSLNSLNEITGISVQSLRTCMNKLISTGEITSESTNRFRLITIMKYDDYQSVERKSTNISTDKLTINQQSTNNQLTTNKKYNKDKNDKNRDIAVAKAPAFSWIEYLKELEDSPRRDLQVIGFYLRKKGVLFETIDQLE